MGEMANFAERMNQRRARQASQNVLLAPQASADLAEEMRIHKITGLPRPAIQADPETAGVQANRITLEKNLSRAPKLSEFMARNPEDAALLADSVDGLSAIEARSGDWMFDDSDLELANPTFNAVVDAAAGSGKRGVLRLRSSPDVIEGGVALSQAVNFDATIEEIADNIMSPEMRAILEASPSQAWMASNAFIKAAEIHTTIQSLKRQGFTPEDLMARASEKYAKAQALYDQAAEIPLSEPATKFRDMHLAKAENTIAGVYAAFEADPIGGAAFVAETAGEFMPILAAAGATSMVGGGTLGASMVMGAGSFGMENSGEVLSFIEQEGGDLSTPEAAIATLQNRELMVEAHKRGLTRAVIISALDMASGGVAGQTLMKNPAADFAMQTVVQMGLGGGGEALGTVAVGDEIKVADVAIEALGEGLFAAPEVATVGGRAVFGDAKRASRSGQTSNNLQEIDQQIDGLPLAEQSPEKLAEAVGAMEGPDINVPAEDVRTFFQANDMSDGDLSKWGIDPTTFDEALQSGGDVSVPMSQYAAYLSGTTAATFLQEHGTFEAGEMSVAEAMQFEADKDAAWQEAWKEAQQEQFDRDALRSTDQQIYDGIFDQLTSAQVPPRVAEHNARVWTSFFNTMGERYGEDALALTQRFGVTVRRDAPQIPEIERRRDQMDVDLETLRRGFEPPKPPTPVLDFIIGRGGVIDTGGDFVSFDPPAGLISETRDQVIERKNSPTLPGSMPSEARGEPADMLARAAVENGLLPAFDGADVEPDFVGPLMEAVDAEIRGQNDFVADESTARLMSLQEELGARGIDLAEMDNDRVIAELEGTPVQASVRALGQPAAPDVDVAPSLPKLMEATQTARTSPERARDAAKDIPAKIDTLIEEVRVAQPTAPAEQVEGAVIELRAARDSVVAALNPQSAPDVATETMPSVQAAPDTDVVADIDAVAEPAPDSAPDALAVDVEVSRPDAPDATPAPTQDALPAALARVETVAAKVEALIAPVEPEIDKLEPGPISGRSFSGERDNKAIVFHSLVDSAGFDPEVLADIFIGPPIDVSKPDGLIKAPPSIPVVRQMLSAAAEDTKVLNAIVESVPVDVVNHLFGSKSAAKVALHDQAMLQDRSTIDADLSVPIVADAADPVGLLISEAARIATELPLVSDLRGEAHEGDSAMAAGKFNTLWQGKDSLGRQRAKIEIDSWGITFSPTKITLFEQSDLSSFQHESAHFFLEVFSTLATDADAPQGMVDDLAAINKYLASTDDATFTTDQHETFARSFEAYLMEGKAPSLELADTFSRIKSWLTRIYKSIRGLDVKLNNNIREVMDRMLATETEIAAAREEAHMRPLFTDAKAVGMTDGDFRTYQRMARRASEQAEQTLLKKTMNRVRIEREAWFRDERNTVKGEVAAEFNSRPVYKAVEAMANRKDLTGSGNEVPDVRINKAELVEQFGDGIIAELAHTKGKRAIWAKDGASPQEVAEFFGFESAVDMIEQMQNARRRRDAIEGETDRRMTERHGDPLSDGSIEDEALAAIHSDQQAQTVAAEVRHLAKRAGKPTKNLTSKVFRQRAKFLIGKMPVRDAAKPAQFLQAERRAARNAEKAFAKVARETNPEESLASAMRFKEQQLLNQMLYREARDIEAMVSKGREKMMAYNKASVRKRLEGGYIEQIDAILEAYDFRKKSDRAVLRAETLADFVARMEEDGRGAELAIDGRLLDEANRKHYTRLSVEELHGLFDTIANLDHLGRFKRKLIDAKEARDLDAVVRGISEAFAANVKQRPPNRTPTKGEERAKTGRDYLNLALNADTLLREVDGRKDLGATWRALKQKVDEGQHRLIDRRIKMAKALDEIYDVYSSAEKRDMGKKRHNEALGGLFSKWDLIAVALNTGNEGNFERLTNPKGKGTFTPEQVREALSVLDDRDWQAVQNIWDYINSFWGEIAAKEKRTTGVTPDKIEGKILVDAPGFVTGGYYPIAYDTRTSGRMRDYQEVDLAQELMAGKFGKAQTKNGHTKERVSTTREPLLLDLSVAHNHLGNVLQDLELGEAVTASWKVLHDRRVEGGFTNAGKKSDFEALEIWLKDVASGERIAARGFEKYLRWGRSGFVISKLALNLSTALIQPTGITQTAVVLGKAATAKGTVSYLSNPARWTQDVLESSPMMRQRQKTFERDVFNVIGEMDPGPKGAMTKFNRDVLMPVYFFMMQKVQFYTVDMPTWVSAYQKHLGETGNEGDARLFADSMVKRAQGSGLMSDRGMLERGTVASDVRQRETYKLFTALGSYMFAKFNVAYERTKDTNFLNPVHTLSWAMDMALLFTLEAVLYSAVKGYLPEEDEPEEWAAWLAGETAFGVLGTMPFVRDVAGAAQGFSSGGIWGSMGETLTKPMTQAAQGEVDKAAVKAFTNFGGMIFHMPASQTNAVVDALFDDDMDLRRDFNPAQLTGLGAGKGRSMFDMMMEN